MGTGGVVYFGPGHRRPRMGDPSLRIHLDRAEPPTQIHNDPVTYVAARHAAPRPTRDEGRA